MDVYPELLVLFVFYKLRSKEDVLKFSIPPLERSSNRQFVEDTKKKCYILISLNRGRHQVELL